MTIVESHFDARRKFVIIIWVYEWINFYVAQVSCSILYALSFKISWVILLCESLFTHHQFHAPCFQCQHLMDHSIVYIHCTTLILIPLCMLNSSLKCTKLCNKWKHPIEMKHLNQTWLIAHKRFFQNTKCIFKNMTTFRNICWTIVQGSNDFFLFWKESLSNKSKGRFYHPKCMEETHVVNLFKYQKAHCIVLFYVN